MVHSFVNLAFKFESPANKRLRNPFASNSFHTLEIGPFVTLFFPISSTLFTKHRGCTLSFPFWNRAVSTRGKTRTVEAPGGPVDYRPH